MTTFKESGLNFTFDDSWEVYQLDSEVDYEKVKRAVPETKCIDFIAFRESDSCLLFVEVKGFRGHATTENLARLRGTQDDLTVEIAQKVRDSLVVLTGGARNSTISCRRGRRI